ncbi:MAG TPA: type IV pili methyl-accepting chemotaxis transducer N-terminal domain-containing protein [Azonexus sp.]
MRHFPPLALFATVLSLTGAPVQAAPAADLGSIAQDIASAGRLRMQSQRLAKLYQQAAMQLNVAGARRQIVTAGYEVDSELAHLGKYARQADTQRQLLRSAAVWQELRTALAAEPKPGSGERVNQLADELMLHAGKLAMQIETTGETPVGRLLDLSSRLNMLSQRMARLYLLAHAGDRSQGVLTDLQQARREFASGLHELDTARENTPASREAIALAKNQWIFFELAIGELHQASRADGRAAQHVATSSERIAQVLDEASAQYVRDYSPGPRAAR